MNANRLAEIRQLAEAATIAPQCGTDAREIFFRTDDNHYKADMRLHHEARGIILDLLDELVQVNCANRLLQAAVDQQHDQSAHSVYCATVAQLTRLEDEAARLRWLAMAEGEHAEYVDG